MQSALGLTWKENDMCGGSDGKHFLTCRKNTRCCEAAEIMRTAYAARSNRGMES